MAPQDIAPQVALSEAGLFCPTCRSEVGEFREHNRRPRARCPKCGSLERHRFLSYVIDRLAPLVASSSAVLDIAPQDGVQDQLQKLAGPRYVGLDIKTVRKVSVCGDIYHLPFPDAVFDVVVCYHVLEHIPDDRSAFRELARVLSARGMMIFQVPYRSAKLTEDDPDATADERTRRFGQHDHVRFYGTDLVERMTDAGLEVSQIVPATLLDAHDLERLAITPEPVWLCRRPDRWSHRRPASLAEATLRLPALLGTAPQPRDAISDGRPDNVSSRSVSSTETGTPPTPVAAKASDEPAAVTAHAVVSPDGSGVRMVVDVRFERLTN